MAYADEIIIDGQRLVLSGGSSLPASFGTSLTAFMTDIQALLNELAYTVQNNHAAAVSVDADAVIAALGGGDTPVTTYSVTATLSHCTSNNSAASIARNASYIADLTADSGYSISSVTVTMGGTDITSTVYNSGSGRISIPYATGNIVITATATVPSVSYTIMKSLTHCTSGNGASSVASGAQYATTLTADTGYTLGTVTVTMGGTDITSTAYNSATHEINIGSVTGNIVITATATANTYTVTNTLSHCSTSNNTSTATHGTAYSATLTADTDYTISSVTVTMGGTDITSAAYSNGMISIASVTGNMVITATAQEIPPDTYTITKNLTHATVSNNASTVEEGSSYAAAVAADTGYTLGTVTVTMGGTDITSAAYSNGSISIASVTGNIVITATATANTYTVTNTLSHCATSNNASTATHGTAYSATLTADTDYAISSVAVTMGGTDITSTVYNSGTGAISIASVTGNIVITASAQSSVPVLSSVSAVFNGGDVVYENTPLNDLKQYMTVTATYSDSSTETVAANDYTLSGTLTVGMSAVTVTYQGLTCTVSVHVLESVTLPSGYTRLSYIVANQSRFETDLNETQVDHAKYELAPDIALMRQSNTNARWNANFFSTDNNGYYYPCFKIDSSGQYGIGFRYKGNGGDVLTDGTELLYAYEDQTPYIIEGLPVIKVNGEALGTAKTGDYTTPRSGTKFIFCHPKTTTNVRYYFYGRIYFFKAWDSSDNLVAHYVPAKSSGDVVGLYDLVSNTFYSSTGTNPFTEPTGV